MMKLNETDARPAAQQIARAIVVAIAEGEFRPGSALPSRSDLMSHFGVANATVQAALERLKADGILIGRQGRGVFVKPGFSPIDMGALVVWLGQAINLAEEDAKANTIRVPDPATGRNTTSVPLSAGATLVRSAQGDRRIVEMLASPVPAHEDPDGRALLQMAAKYAQFPGYNIAWHLGN